MTRPKQHLFAQDEQQLATWHKAFCHPARVRIPGLLDHYETMSVSELSGNFPLSEQAVSDHLQKLYEVGFLTMTEAGRYNYYCIDEQALRRFQQALNEYIDTVCDRVSTRRF